MQTAARIILALALLALAGFCVFGFMATFEPSTSLPLPWRIGYGVIGAASIVGAILLFRRRRTDSSR